MSQNLGTEFSKDYDSVIKGKKIIKWIMEGSTDEDSPMCRATNHFHNPLPMSFNDPQLPPWSQSGMSDQPLWMNIWCFSWKPWYSNITWATGFTEKNGNKISPVKQSMGWDNARAYYKAALTSESDTGRETYFAKTFQAVGQVLHLLQDMAVPAHVRNDFTSHLTFNKVTSLNPIKWFGNPFEYYIQGKPYLVTTSGAPVYPSFSNPQVTDFWDTDQYTGQDPSTLISSYLGIAEFTNANYFSDETIPSNKPSTEHSFPFPKINISETYICDDSLPGSNKPTKYISRKPCNVSSETEGIDHFVAVSLLNKESAITNTNIQILKAVLDDNVHNTYSKKLLPRAVGYSAGLLNYFFRGTIGIELDQNSPDEAVVENLSSERMTGIFSLYYDDSNNNRNFVKGWGLDIMPYSPEYVSLSSCDLSNLSPKPEKFILAFQGKMGNETGAVVGNADITSLKTTTCGTELTISGPDTINKNSSQQYTAAGCTGCSDDVTWSASGTGAGADIDKDGHLSASDTACGTVTLTAECSKCNTSSSRNIKVNCDPLTIIGPDLVEKNKIYNYKAEGCCEEVEWYALGIGATIIPGGILITDDTLTGLITVVAICQKCDTFATKDVKTPCDPEIAITGSDTIAKSEMQQYVASGCNKPVAWSVDGKATITETGLLVTDETSCGPLTVNAQCPECEPPATKNVQITCDPLTITGSDTTTKNSTKQYTSADCCGEVQWTVSGKGATISSTGLLTTGSTACGTLTITATCTECGTSATQDVRITNAGTWTWIENINNTAIWHNPGNEPEWPSCYSGLSVGKVCITYNGKTRTDWQGFDATSEWCSDHPTACAACAAPYNCGAPDGRTTLWKYKSIYEWTCS